MRYKIQGLPRHQFAHLFGQSDADTGAIHAHNAIRGCFSARIERTQDD